MVVKFSRWQVGVLAGIWALASVMEAVVHFRSGNMLAMFFKVTVALLLMLLIGSEVTVSASVRRS